LRNKKRKWLEKCPHCRKDLKKKKDQGIAMIVTDQLFGIPGWNKKKKEKK
jgi:hypothetical protein